MASQNKQYPNVIEVIGNTPLVKLKLDSEATILAKLEYLNPGGSIKDRPALFMIEEAERTGKLKPGDTIIEASSGNQGIAIAMIGAAKGYKTIIVVPDKTSNEKIATLQAYGAEVVVCPSSNDPKNPDSYLPKAQVLLKQHPHAFMPNQYINSQNPLAHYKTTGPEIWKQTEGTITHFIAGKGSCGTISGVGKYLKEQNKNIKIICIDEDLAKDPGNHYKIEGIGTGMEDNLDRSVIDKFVLVSGVDAFKTAKEIAQKHGIFGGLSSGAILHATRQLLPQLKPSDVAVIILADSGRAYLQKLFK